MPMNFVFDNLTIDKYSSRLSLTAPTHSCSMEVRGVYHPANFPLIHTALKKSATRQKDFFASQGGICFDL